MAKIDEKKIKQGWETIIEGLGLSLEDENFIGTPGRMVRAYKEIFRGLERDSYEDMFEKAFPSKYSGLVMVKGIECYSMCPHHFLPVRYRVTIGYISKNKMLGLSKMARLVEEMASRPELQETFTEEVADCLKKHLGAEGVMVVVAGDHYCMRMRGVKMKQATTVTSSVKGDFESNPVLREEFMTLAK
jgi:GTP cyclohydrolase I